MTKYAVYTYTLVLMAYTGWRTFDFMGSQLPKDNISFWLAVIFLFAAEIGLLTWHTLALSHATTEQQEQIAKVMAVIDFIGSTGAGVADMITRQTMLAGYEMPVWLAEALMWGLPAVVALNVAAVLLYQWFDAAAWLAREQRQATFEITKQAIVALRNDRSAIATAKHGLIYQTVKNQIEHTIDSQYANRQAAKQAPSMPELQPPLALPLNGQSYNQEVVVSKQDPTQPGTTRRA